MRGLLAGAGAFALPTRGEGWGLPVMEATAMDIWTYHKSNPDWMSVMKAMAMAIVVVVVAGALMMVTAMVMVMVMAMVIVMIFGCWRRRW